MEKDNVYFNALGQEWYHELQSEIVKPYFQDIVAKLRSAKMMSTVIYPEGKDVFNAYKLTPLSAIKVVVLGQDPYHDGSAHGLAFSCLNPTKTPPSLANIYREVETDVANGLDLTWEDDLTRWAQQGVFLLNTVLTVEQGKPNSHKGWGWEKFTLTTIKAISDRKDPVVFMLWGKQAQAYAHYIAPHHLVLTATHPSPLGANKGGWFGCKHFSKANEFLKEHGKEIIRW